MDDNLARQAFENALHTYSPEFETFFLSRLVGLSFTYGADTLSVEFPVRDFLYNPQGSLHGGILAFVLDVAMGHLLKRTLGVPGSTLEMKTQFLAPVRGKAARCEARFLRKGTNICFLEGRLFDENDVLAVVGTSTWRVNWRSEASKRSEHGTSTSDHA